MMVNILSVAGQLTKLRCGNMWKLKFEYGCWYAEGQLGQQIWSKDRSQLEKLLEAAGYEYKSVEDEKF